MMNHFHTIENTFASLEQYSIAVRQLIKTVPGKLKTPTQPSNNRANTIARNFNNNKVLKKALEHFENNTINQLNESINHFLDRLDFPVDVLDKINYFNQKYARIEVRTHISIHHTTPRPSSTSPHGPQFWRRHRWGQT